MNNDTEVNTSENTKLESKEEVIIPEEGTAATVVRSFPMIQNQDSHPSAGQLGTK